MDLTHRLRVPAPLDEVWAAVNDPARIAAVLPGVLVDAVDEDGFAGRMTIKLSSSLLALTGSGRYVTRDEGGHRVVVTTTGADRRGDAAVEARHTLTLARVGGAETEVAVATSMTWSGRPARLGDGVVADAVGRVLEHAGTRIAARVAEGLPWLPAADESRPSDRGAEAVADHPVELGADLGDLDAPGSSSGPASAPAAPSPGPSPRPAPSPSPGPAPRPPREEYVYRPYANAAEPHLDAVRTFSRVVGRRVVPYAGLAALAAFGVATVVRRVRR